MPFTTFYGPNTTVSEKCLWVVDGTRRICISYDYNTSNGILRYAASVYRVDIYDSCLECNVSIEPDEQDMIDHAHTTSRRFEIRPVIIQVASGLTYDDIIKTIRREMCHGYGCKGPRNLGQAFNYEVDLHSDDDGSSSVNSFLSEDTVYDEVINDEKLARKRIRYLRYIINDEKLARKRVRYLRYISESNIENFCGQRIPVTREFFIAFKANKNTGDLIYGAAISHRSTDLHEMVPLSDELVESHYKTAEARMEKAPVYINIPEDYRHQLIKNADHREDVMYTILDRIQERESGRLAIRYYNR